MGLVAVPVFIFTLSVIVFMLFQHWMYLVLRT